MTVLSDARGINRVGKTLVVGSFAVLAALTINHATAGTPTSADHGRMIEWTITSKEKYPDPFNDVEVDVIFSSDGRSWRVPTFWRGAHKWTVRFAPPVPGEYVYRLESTDPNNADLNGHEGRLTVRPYSGNNSLLKHGMLRVSANKRYFEYEDGTPFYWLGDTWWTGLSDRLPWDGFKKLTADRKTKGFTVIQTVAGLIPPEELAPVDPGYRNEGGAVWDPDFKQINPRYFDMADRRIGYLLDEGLTPAIVGAWGPLIEKVGISVLKKHWRYIIARYGAYPVFWIAGGEVFDPPEEATKLFLESSFKKDLQRGWTDIVRYIRAIDPYRHPVTAHEAQPPFDFPLQDESLTDFDMFQSSHFGWESIAVEVAQMTKHYARSSLIKPLVEGEVGYERLGEIHLEDFQRTAFWLSMLNGAAGHTYGANGTWEAYTGDKPMHRVRYSFLTWEEGMNLPGSYQLGLGAKLLGQYPWWRFEPHPEWVTPRGTTLLEPHPDVNGFDIGRGLLRADPKDFDTVSEALEVNFAGGEWAAKHGNFRLPYAAGIPSVVRIIYIPTRPIFLPSPAPTVLGLESGVRYNAYFVEPTTGTRIDLGAVERPPPGTKLFGDALDSKNDSWTEQSKDQAAPGNRGVPTNCETLMMLNKVRESDAVATVEASGATQAGLVLRYDDADRYIAAMYSPEAKVVYLLDRRDGRDGRPLGKTAVPSLGTRIRLSAEVRGDKAAASVTDGQSTYTTPIIDITNTASGSAGLRHRCQGPAQSFRNFELRQSPVLTKDEFLQRELRDARGMQRGELVGDGMSIGSFKVAGWDRFGRDKHILLDAYRPEKLPTSGDWILVFETKESHEKLSHSRPPPSN